MQLARMGTASLVTSADTVTIFREVRIIGKMLIDTGFGAVKDRCMDSLGVAKTPMGPRISFHQVQKDTGLMVLKAMGHLVHHSEARRRWDHFKTWQGDRPHLFKNIVHFSQRAHQRVEGSWASLLVENRLVLCHKLASWMEDPFRNLHPGQVCLTAEPNMARR